MYQSKEKYICKEITYFAESSSDQFSWQPELSLCHTLVYDDIFCCWCHTSDDSETKPMPASSHLVMAVITYTIHIIITKKQLNLRVAICNRLKYFVAVS